MVVTARRHNPWLWIPSLFVAEEIPSAVVMFVALLMFLQFGANPAQAAMYGGLLFLPWVLKSYLYTKVRKAATFKWRLHTVELLTFACLIGIAVYLSMGRVKVWALFLFLLVLSLLCAWHELLSRLYYQRMLTPREQPLYGTTKMLSSQVSLAVTYGLLIIVAGVFEVFFRSYQKAWAMESSLVAGVFLLMCIVNLFVLYNPPHQASYRYESWTAAVRNEWHVVERIQRKPGVLKVLASLFLLLLPQALLFHTRVFFLLDEPEMGGLGCSVQDVGFAQGTIGVIAFSIGLALGRWLMGHRGAFWYLSVALTASPVFYLLMAQWPQRGDLLALCLMTFSAQLCFGLGLNVCVAFVRYVSGHRYANTYNYLYVPLVSSLMVVPMMLSGWLSTTLGYSHFFMVCVVLAPVAWCVAALLQTRRVVEEADAERKGMDRQKGIEESNIL